MSRVRGSMALVLVLAACGCSTGGGPVAPDPPAGNTSFSNLTGEWASAERTLTIDGRSVTIVGSGEVRYLTYGVKSFNGYGCDLLMSDGDEWFAVAAGNLLSIQSGKYKGAYQFVHG